ncbi:MAG TPA: DUF4915 domain-containing protein [Chloroflexia bacterium]|nr:DUF4915 domain-containing protein [Chloroflexia bacterium]
MISQEELSSLWARHHAEWRGTAQIASQWEDAARVDPKLLRYHVRGDWWKTLAGCGVTLIVTREYEHLVMAMSVVGDAPSVTYMPMPHPSGLVVDPNTSIVYIASTRNPNQIYELAPVTGIIPRQDMEGANVDDHPLVPVRSHFFPGCLYMHDLALIGGTLHANAVGQNAVVRFGGPEGGCDGHERVWWPRCIETESGPVFSQNHIQLNSIAAGSDLASSYFSASTDKLSTRRPGHKNFPVDKRGVIFSGATREAVVRGLTRPHSARLHEGKVWVDNSGYGEVGIGSPAPAGDGRFEPATRLPGWTRGLCFHERIAFVGTSRVIPRFRQYAPGLDLDSSLCGIHAVDTQTGEVVGSIIWPYGNQIFALDTIPAASSTGFPFRAGTKRATEREKRLFYAFKTNIQ